MRSRIYAYVYITSKCAPQDRNFEKLTYFKFIKFVQKVKNNFWKEVTNLSPSPMKCPNAFIFKISDWFPNFVGEVFGGISWKKRPHFRLTKSVYLSIKRQKVIFFHLSQLPFPWQFDRHASITHVTFQVDVQLWHLDVVAWRKFTA